ncbi:unnamed protein product [Ilex paraguariensis]|uniref:Exostosin GT47 domain-containing protein n=1 Tax=Ilex paraguariensis TaxID=185542 RepID=A0ABC8TX96_9AQUA
MVLGKVKVPWKCKQFIDDICGILHRFNIKLLVGLVLGSFCFGLVHVAGGLLRPAGFGLFTCTVHVHSLFNAAAGPHSSVIFYLQLGFDGLLPGFSAGLRQLSFLMVSAGSWSAAWPSLQAATVAEHCSHNRSRELPGSCYSCFSAVIMLPSQLVSASHGFASVSWLWISFSCCSPLFQLAQLCFGSNSCFHTVAHGVQLDSQLDFNWVLAGFPAGFMQLFRSLLSLPACPSWFSCSWSPHLLSAGALWIVSSAELSAGFNGSPAGISADSHLFYGLCAFACPDAAWIKANFGLSLFVQAILLLLDDLTATLVQQCHQFKFTVQRIIETAGDNEALLFEALNVNDEIQKVLSNYEEMIKSSGIPREPEPAMIPIAVEPDESPRLGKEESLIRKPGGKIRAKLVLELNGVGGVVIDEGSAGEAGKAAAQSGMRKSIYCPCPAGDTPSSARLFDAIVSGCIPIIISDELELPFEGILDYRKIALFVSSSDAVQPGSLLKFLRSVSPAQIRAMQMNLAKLSRHFLYSHPAQPMGPEDLIWRMLAGKLVNIKLHTRRSQRVVKESRNLCTCDCKRANFTSPALLS